MAVSPTVFSARDIPGACTGAPGDAVFLDAAAPGQTRLAGRRFSNPVEIVAAYNIDQVVPALHDVQRHVEAGLHAVGFVAYEAGAAFEPAFPHRPLQNHPYVWFALYDEPPEPVILSAVESARVSPLRPLVSRDEYVTAIERIRDWIAAGDTYQVNFTFPLHGLLDADPSDLFAQLAARQNDAAFRTFLNIGTHCLASISPELFFRLDGHRITTRPMKGTAPRHPDPIEDIRNSEKLRESPKECAENLMIVDLLRNDLGRIAETGSVQVERLFDVERYQTLWTMTSTISAETRASVAEIFTALFPSGSVTGAPKIRTMQIIDALEHEPRGAYCGAIGWWGPGRQAEFSVGIRTLILDAEKRTATYRVGSGITWDSHSGAEYDECLLKAAVLSQVKPDFDLLESLRLENGSFWLLDRHLARLRTSAAYFGRPFDEESVRTALHAVSAEHPKGIYKVRMLLAEQGGIETTCELLPPAQPWRVCLAKRPIPSQSPFVYNKTTYRAHYGAAIQGCEDVDDVLLFNENGELTETTRANLVLELDGNCVTPPRSAGLLPGTFREELLAQGAIEEHALTPGDLHRATRIRLVNSVRGWIDVDLVRDPAGPSTP